MTTVVFDGYMLAGDTKATYTQNGELQNCPSCDHSLDKTVGWLSKLRVPKEPVEFKGSKVVVMAGAGGYLAFQPVFDAIEQGMDLAQVHGLIKKAKGMTNYSILVVTEATCWMISGHTKFICNEVTQFPVAIGSGSEVAKFAWTFLGVGAFGAVGAALHADPATGGKIEYIVCRPEEGEEIKLQKDTWSEQEMHDYIKGLNK